MAENDDFQGKTSQVTFNAVQGNTITLPWTEWLQTAVLANSTLVFVKCLDNSPSIAYWEARPFPLLMIRSIRKYHGLRQRTVWRINISQSTAGSVVKIQKVVDSGEWVEVSESTISAGDQSILEARSAAEEGSVSDCQLDTSIEDFINHTHHLCIDEYFTGRSTKNDFFTKRTTAWGKHFPSANLDLASSELGEPIHHPAPTPKSLWWNGPPYRRIFPAME